MPRQQKIALIIAACILALAILCCCCLLVGGGSGGWALYTFAQEQAGFLFPEKAPPAVPELYEPSVASDQETLAALAATEIPVRDLRELGVRLKGLESVPLVVRETPLPLKVGDRETFWVADNRDPEHVEYFEAEAELAYISNHAYFWVEDDFEIDVEDLKRSAEAFDEAYEVDRSVFGEEWSPGIDGDPKLHIFNGKVPGVGGYFSSADEFSRLINPRSNEREMFYINLDVTQPNDSIYDSVLAHEFQHMIHWNIDQNEPSWVNEGCSDLAMALNGYVPTDGGLLFAMFGPDTQLNTWDNHPSRSVLHYGASYAFMRYLYYRFGKEAVRDIVADPRDGEAGLSSELAEHDYTFDAFFKEWTLANYLNDGRIPEGQYASPGVLQAMKIDKTHSRYPAKRKSAVHQYGTDYVVFEPEEKTRTLHVAFDGANRTRILPTAPHSGDYFWYSHRGDSSDMTLTRRFDLGGLSSATLTFWTWYDIEHGWDYGYVEVSADNGQTWTILEGPRTTDYNPAGNSFGPGYTGETKKWVQEEIDLSDYAGREVLVRFEYITDDAYNTPGWALDDIAIEELGLEDDVEAEESEWEAQGFVRVTSFMPQRFSVQFIVFETSGLVTFRDLSLDADQQGEREVADFGGDVEQVVMLVSGLTPVTTEWAYYEYQATVE
jgi:immune inhibitor A